MYIYICVCVCAPRPCPADSLASAGTQPRARARPGAFFPPIHHPTPAGPAGPAVAGAGCAESPPIGVRARPMGGGGGAAGRGGGGGGGKQVGGLEKLSASTEHAVLGTGADDSDG